MPTPVPVVNMTYHHALMEFDMDTQKLAADFSRRGGFRRPLERVVREVGIPSIELNFQSGGRPSSWPAAQPDSNYRRRYGSSSMYSALMVTHKMFRAATALARWHIRENRLTYGNFPETVWYAAVHDSAESSARAGHPHRPFAMFQEEDVPRIQDIFLEWLEERVNSRIKRRYA